MPEDPTEDEEIVTRVQFGDGTDDGEQQPQPQEGAEVAEERARKQRPDSGEEFVVHEIFAICRQNYLFLLN
jgi:hypothetical protein